MVTVVTRCDATVAPGSVPGVAVVDRRVGPVNGGLAGRLQADADPVVVRHAHDVADLELVEGATDVGMSSVTTFPRSPRMVTVRAVWSTASTVPRSVICSRTASVGLRARKGG